MEIIRTFIEYAGLILELAGVCVIVIGAVFASVRAVRQRYGGEAHSAYKHFRSHLGRGILLGLEFLVAGDIINTVAVEPTYTSVGVLAIIVLIRTFLSFALEVEMTGRWPWQGKAEQR